MSINRIRKELEELKKDPPSNCSAGPTLENLYTWEGQIIGPEDTPYYGGIFRFTSSLLIVSSPLFLAYHVILEWTLTSLASSTWRGSRTLRPGRVHDVARRERKGIRLVGGKKKAIIGIDIVSRKWKFDRSAFTQAADLTNWRRQKDGGCPH